MRPLVINSEKKVSRVAEEYCEAIYELQRTTGQPPKAAHLAARLSVSPVTVHATLKRLVRDGLISLDPRTKGIVLTEAGLEIAQALHRRQALASQLLSDVLGMEREAVTQEAEAMKHSITARLEEALARYLQGQVAC